MIRATRAALASALLVAFVILSSGCQPKVEVKTGTRIVCTEGHVISQNVRTVEVPANEIAAYRVKTSVRTCDKHAGVAAVYAEAQTAIAAGDLKTAQDRLARVVAVDATYRKAKAQLDEVKANRKPTVDEQDTSVPPAGTPVADAPAPGTPEAKPGDGDTATPAASLLIWAPDSIQGFAAAKAAIDPLNIARDYVPATGSSVASFVIVAEQGKTSAGAEAALSAQVKRKYSSDKDTITVGDHKAYFGTDGRRFAALGFTDGAVMVALEMSATTGGSPESLKSALVSAAQQLP